MVSLLCVLQCNVNKNGIGWGWHSSLWPVSVAGSPSPLMLYINSFVYISVWMLTLHTQLLVYMHFHGISVLYQLAINYAHYQPYLYEFIVLYSTSNKLRPHFLFLVNLHTIHNRKHKYYFVSFFILHFIYLLWQSFTLLKYTSNTYFISFLVHKIMSCMTNILLRTNKWIESAGDMKPSRTQHTKMFTLCPITCYSHDCIVYAKWQ